MTEFTIQLGEDDKEFIEGQVAAGGFPSASAYVEALVREARKQKAWAHLEHLAQEGLATPVREMTQEDWHDIRRSVEIAVQEGSAHAPNPPS